MDIKQIGPALAGACIVEPQSLNQGFGILADDVTFCYYTRKPPAPNGAGVCFQPLTEPAVMPSMMNRCASR